MNKVTITVGGMSCESCVGHVTNALANLPGTTNIDVNLGNGTASVDFDGKQVTTAEMVAAINEDGYSANVAETV